MKIHAGSPSDLGDAEWALIAPLIPPAKRGGRRRKVDVREVMNGVFYVLGTGCQWRALPKDLPPKSTVHDYLTLWDWDGTLERIHHALYLMSRDAAWRIELVKRSAQAKGFEVIPRRWVVERTIAWINRCRRLAKDYESLNRTAIAFGRLASIRLILRRLTRYCYRS